MKGIILHGGHGTRLRPLTHTGPKQLLKIANKPMSQYALEDLKNIGITDIAIIIGDVYPEKVKEYYGDGTQFGVDITYVFQDEPKGIAHAIGLCKNFVGDDDFVVYLGDNILRQSLEKHAKKFQESSNSAFILLAEVPDPTKFGVVKLDGKKILEIVEKPKVPPSNYAVIGVYFLNPSFFEIIEKLTPSWRNELEITEALQLFMKSGGTINYDFVTGWWKDTGTPEDIIDANRLILDILVSENKSKLVSSKVNTKNIIHPVIIGKNCDIDDSVTLGPYVSVGDGVTLKNCKIDNSIVMDNCLIDSNIHISDSIIASNSIIENKNLKKHAFLLGERSKINS